MYFLRSFLGILSLDLSKATVFHGRMCVHDARRESNLTRVLFHNTTILGSFFCGAFFFVSVEDCRFHVMSFFFCSLVLALVLSYFSPDGLRFLTYPHIKEQKAMRGMGKRKKKEEKPKTRTPPSPTSHEKREGSGGAVRGSTAMTLQCGICTSPKHGSAPPWCCFCFVFGRKNNF